MNNVLRLFFTFSRRDLRPNHVFMVFELWLIAVVRCRYWIGKMAFMKTLWKRNFTNAIWFIAKDFFNLDPFLCKSRQINILKIIDMHTMRTDWILKCIYAIFFPRSTVNGPKIHYLQLLCIFDEIFLKKKDSKCSSNYISKWLNLLNKCHLVSAFVCYLIDHSVKWKYMIGKALI